ncbi:hypothetical protein [Variovorax boronicumulans]|uniref:hypothetical protein n=1 Tax=Variovorax boronicumulans TaxID=436515 RepID=UPI0012E5413C|nr:hypothetical protein [Variovorax boronicumulans]GER16722.1 hypothetical protein VCH24_17290 [Variovorax boronicumulans]
MIQPQTRPAEAWIPDEATLASWDRTYAAKKDDGSLQREADHRALSADVQYRNQTGAAS